MFYESVPLLEMCFGGIFHNIFFSFFISSLLFFFFFAFSCVVSFSLYICYRLPVLSAFIRFSFSSVSGSYRANDFWIQIEFKFTARGTFSLLDFYFYFTWLLCTRVISKREWNCFKKCVGIYLMLLPFFRMSVAVLAVSKLACHTEHTVRTQSMYIEKQNTHWSQFVFLRIRFVLF